MAAHRVGLYVVVEDGYGNLFTFRPSSADPATLEAQGVTWAADGTEPDHGEALRVRAAMEAQRFADTDGKLDG